MIPECREFSGLGLCYPWQARHSGVLLMTPLMVTHPVQRCFRQELHRRVWSWQITVPQSSQTALVAPSHNEHFRVSSQIIFPVAACRIFR